MGRLDLCLVAIRVGHPNLFSDPLMFDLEEYEAFLRLQEEYEERKAALASKIFPIIRKMRKSETYPGQRHAGSLDDALYFHENDVGYQVYCCGSSDYDSVSIKDLTNPEWHIRLEEKAADTDRKFKEHAAKARQDEIEKAEKRLKELKG